MWVGPLGVQTFHSFVSSSFVACEHTLWRVMCRVCHFANFPWLVTSGSTAKIVVLSPSGLNLIGKSTMASHSAYSNPGTQVGAQKKDFSTVWQVDLTRSEILFLFSRKYWGLCRVDVMVKFRFADCIFVSANSQFPLSRLQSSTNRSGLDCCSKGGLQKVNNAIHQTLAPVVQKMDSTIHWINHYPVDNY